MNDVKIIEVKQSVFADNNARAALLRDELTARGTHLINLMSSPGAGKTSLLLALAPYLTKQLSVAVMEADIDSSVDAETLLAAGIPSIQIHTGGMCHLDADMTRQGIDEVEGHHDLLILENVGNLVCPAEFDTGAHTDMTILSVPEGDDKPLKYPLMYERCSLLVINKVDVLPYFDFDCEKVAEYARRRNPNIRIFYVSAKTGEGIEDLANHLISVVKKKP